MAAANTYTPIATVTLASNQSSDVIFTSIPSTYTDLYLVINAGATTTNTDYAIRVNNDSGTNYSWTGLWGSGSGSGSLRGTAQDRYKMTYYGNLDTNLSGTIGQINFQNYSNTTTYKTMFGGSRNGATYGVYETVCLWRNTVAINQINILISGTCLAGSTFSLYGITAA